MNEINQHLFWKLIYFVSSVTFCGFFVSLPASIAIIAMIHLNCLAHSMARRRLGHNCLGVYHLPLFGATSVFRGFVLYEKERFLVAIAGSIAGLTCSLIFCAYCVLLNAPGLGEIAKILIILNLINLLPISIMDGSQICRSIGFSNSAFLGYFLLAIGVLTSYLLTMHSIFFLFFLVVCIWDYRVLLFHREDTRRMSKKEQFIATATYSAIIAILITLYSFVNEFQGSGAMDPFMVV